MFEYVSEYIKVFTDAEPGFESYNGYNNGYKNGYNNGYNNC